MLSNRRYAVIDSFMHCACSALCKLRRASSHLDRFSEAISRQLDHQGWTPNHEELLEGMKGFVESENMFAQLHYELEMLDHNSPNAMHIKVSELIKRYETALEGKKGSITGIFLTGIFLIILVAFASTATASRLLLANEDLPNLWSAVVIPVATICMLLKTALDLSKTDRRLREDAIKNKLEGALTIKDVAEFYGDLQDRLAELARKYEQLMQDVGCFKDNINPGTERESSLKNVADKLDDIKMLVHHTFEDLTTIRSLAENAAKGVHVLKDLHEILEDLPRNYKQLSPHHEK